MLEIWRDDAGRVHLKGRLDASQTVTADRVMEQVDATCEVDFSNLDYISSAGLSVLLRAQQHLADSEQELILVGMNPHIKMVFELAGFDNVFTIR